METRKLSQLKVNPNNPRGEVVVDGSLRGLAESIKAQGVLQPILITPNGTIVCGHRRVKACEIAGLSTVPIVVRDLTEKQQLQVMLIENLQREDLNVLQTAKAYQLLIDHGLSIRQIAKATGFRVESISHYVDILALHPDLHNSFDGDGALALGCVRYLLPLSPDDQVRIGKLAREHGWTIPQIARAASPTTKTSVRQPVSKHLEGRATAPAVAATSSGIESATDQSRIAPIPEFKVWSGCPKEREAHLEYALDAVRELLKSSPDDALTSRYQKWISILESDLELEREKLKEKSTFRASIDLFQRQPKERTKASKIV